MLPLVWSFPHNRSREVSQKFFGYPSQEAVHSESYDKKLNIKRQGDWCSTCSTVQKFYLCFVFSQSFFQPFKAVPIILQPSVVSLDFFFCTSFSLRSMTILGEWFCIFQVTSIWPVKHAGKENLIKWSNKPEMPVHIKVNLVKSLHQVIQPDVLALCVTNTPFVPISYTTQFDKEISVLVPEKWPKCCCRKVWV